jgi:hypothetical protein
MGFEILILSQNNIKVLLRCSLLKPNTLVSRLFSKIQAKSYYEQTGPNVIHLIGNDI